MAVSDIDKHRRRWEENPKGLTFAPYADALRKAGEAEQALDVLKAGLEHHPDYIPANIVLGRCHLDLGDDLSAEGAFERVLSLDPENVIALKALADVSERGQRWASARRWLDLLLSIDRGNDVARDQMARVQVAELEHAQQAEAPTYPDAPESDWAGDAAAAPDDAPAEAGLHLESVQTFAPGEADVVHAEGLVNRETVDPRDIAAGASEGIDLGASFADAVTLTDAEHDDGTPSVDFVVEAHHDDIEPISLQAAAGEFAVASAAEMLVTGGEESAADDGAGISWSDVGEGEFVPAIFADEAGEAAASALPPVTNELVLDPSAVTLTLGADAGASVMLDEPELNATTVESFEIESSEDLDTVPAVVFDVADANPALESAGFEPVAPAAGNVTDSGVPVQQEASAPSRVEVPSPVGLLSLDASEVLSLEQHARAAVLGAFVARRSLVPVDVLGRAPVADPVVVAAMAVPAALAADATTVESESVESLVVWDEWTWGEHDPDLPLLEELAQADAAAARAAAEVALPEAALAVPVAVPETVAVALDEAAAAQLDDAPVEDVVVPVPASQEAAAAVLPTAEPVSAFAPASRDVATDDEHGAVPPNFAAPILVTTAMAALYEQQGHLREALATYRELDARSPGAHTARISAIESTLAAAAIPAPPVYAARLTGGQPAREFFGALLRTMPPALVRTTDNGTDEGTALRKAADPVSLGRLFGEESSSPRPRAVAARTASFDEFYGAAAAPAETNGRDDLESFHAWLQGLKT